MAYKEDHNIYIGSLLGSLKGVKLEKNDGVWKSCVKSLRKVDCLDTTQGVTAMAWGDKEEREILIGLADQTVKVYDTEYLAFVSSLKAGVGQGPICGISRFNEAVVVAVASGHIRVIACENSSDNVLNVDGTLEKMKHNSLSGNIIGTGGKDRDLQLWDLEKQKCIFTAKNVKNDYLDLQVPVWVSDLDFMPNSDMVALCSRHGHVRLYDPRGQRRPVFNFHIQEQVLTACGVTASGDKIIVGSGTGRLTAVDIRGRGLLGHEYKGSVGSVRSIVCHPTEQLIFSVGLDRHLKVHNVESSKLLYKEYLKTKLCSLLVRREFFYKHQKMKQAADSDCEIVDLTDNEEGEEGTEEEEEEEQNPLKSRNEKRAYNKLFDNMESVMDERKAKKTKRKRL